MLLKQLCSFATSHLGTAYGESRHYSSKEDLIDWLTNDSKEDIDWNSEITFQDVRRRIQEIFPGLYSFDGVNVTGFFVSIFGSIDRLLFRP